jgi:hypothetical protein
MRYHLELAGVIALAIVAFAAREVAAQPGVCVRAQIEEPFVLPDGARQPSGLLRICMDYKYSPVAGLHTVSAGQAAVTARFFSRRVKAEGVSTGSPHLAFVRDGAGALVLRGYTVESDGAVEVYWFEPPRRKRAVPADALVARAPETGTVWLAAARIP